MLSPAIPRTIFVLAVWWALAGAGRARELEPVGRGPYAIGCTNLEVTPRDGTPMFDFLNGEYSSEKTTYLTDILTHPDAVPTVEIAVPDAKVFGPLAGRRQPVVIVVFYPTAADNARPAYAFPYKDTGDREFPHMQAKGDKPILPDRAARYPLVVVSGGYNTHPLWHLDHLKMLASHGYIVADVVHGDGRCPSMETNTALRPLHVKAAIDHLLRDPDFGRAIDPDRIGAAGQSAGGHTVMALLGGVDPTKRIPRCADARIKAAFGLVPLMGGEFGIWPMKFDAWYFGRDHSGLREVRKPFLAVYGERDDNVPARGVESGVRALAGAATAVMLDAESHGLSAGAQQDAFAWEVLFFDAWLRNDTTARRQLIEGTSVRGGVNDHKTIDHPPAASRS